MHVDDVARITMHDRVRHVTQIPGQRYELNVVRVQHSVDVDARGDHLRGDSARARPCERARARTIARDHDDITGPAIAEPIEVIEDRLQICAAAGREHGNARACHRRGN